MSSFVGCGFFRSDGCFLCPHSGMNNKTVIIHLSKTGLFCLMPPYRCLFKNSGRWLEFNVRVIAWSTALIFVFEWSGCIAKPPITVIGKTLPSHVLSSFERDVGSMELRVSLGSSWVCIGRVSKVLHRRCKMTQEIQDGQSSRTFCESSDFIVGFSTWEQWLKTDPFGLDSAT